MIGRRLVTAWRQAGHEVHVVTRTPRGAGKLSWQDNFPETDAAVHLAGAPINARRWTPAFIAELHRSRVETAQLLRSKLAPRCRLVITMSGANGYPWGNLKSRAHTEADALDSGTVLGRLCAAWEGVWENFPGRVVALRAGFVIARDDGGIRTMLPFYRAGLGGVLGSGRQRMPWISIGDLVEIFNAALLKDDLHGPVNAVGPRLATFADFNAAMARAVKVPALWRIPSFAVRALWGRMADEMLLCDAAVLPEKLAEHGFQWRCQTVDDALQAAFRL